MNTLNTGWIVLIVISSVIVIGGLFYFFYRLYINHIYKRKRSWDEITSSSKNKSEKNNTIISLMPRLSMSPLIQEFLPSEMKKKPVQRKMITHLQFTEAPLLINNLKIEWDEMDTKNSYSTQLMSTRTSYDTLAGRTSCEESLVKYFSITSSNELITPPSSVEQLSSASSSHPRSPLQIFFNPFVNLSKQLINHEKNNSSNHVIVEMEKFKEKNILNNVSQV